MEHYQNVITQANLQDDNARLLQKTYELTEKCNKLERQDIERQQETYEIKERCNGLERQVIELQQQLEQRQAPFIGIAGAPPAATPDLTSTYGQSSSSYYSAPSLHAPAYRLEWDPQSGTKKDGMNMIVFSGAHQLQPDQEQIHLTARAQSSYNPDLDQISWHKPDFNSNADGNAGPAAYYSAFTPRP